VTDPGDDTIVELDAPVIIFGILTFQLCMQLGESSATPLPTDGESSTQLFGFTVVIDIAGLPGVVL
jgi:hypothetical protein